MRYYSIAIRHPQTGKVVVFDEVSGIFRQDPNALQTYGSHDPASGLFDPNALNVELDIPALPFGTFQGNLSARVWGVPLQALGQAGNLAGFDIEILGGMRPPYGLNIAAKPGQLAVGQVFQSYGNWEGLNQHLDLILNNAAVNPNLDAPITFTWAADQNMADAIANALTAAFPGFSIVGADKVQRLVQDHDEPAVHDNLLSFCEYVLDRTQEGTYSGIQIRGVGRTFYLYDSSIIQKPTQIEFPDIIGQPTWISSAAISFSTVMRGDIALGSTVTMPPGLFPPYVLTTPNPSSPVFSPLTRLGFQGSFLITEVHHFGDFRTPQADGWRTEFVGVTDAGNPNSLPEEPELQAGTLA